MYRTELMYRRNEPFRIPIYPPIDSTYRSIGGYHVVYGNAKIIDMSPNGLRIIANTKIPLHTDIVISFTMNAHNYMLTGKIVWQKQQYGEYICGLSMNNDEQTRSQLTQDLKEYARRQKELEKLK